jgi:hypothetical protein
MAIREVIIIGDFLKDLDDEHTLCLSAKLHRDGVIDLRCVIGNLEPAMLRARGAKGTLMKLGLGDIPVGVGMPVFKGREYPYESQVPYISSTSDVHENGYELLVRVLKSCRRRNVILVLQSGLTDACELLRRQPILFKSKIRQVAIMGGIEINGQKARLSSEGRLVPNNANNNTFDMLSAERLYEMLQRERISMVITTRDAAYACQIPFSAYDEMETTGNAVGLCLKGRQKPALQKLWEAACSPAGSDIRGTLPSDRNREWFVNVFCGGKKVDIADGADIWPFVDSFNLYDPINFVAAIPSLRRKFFWPEKIMVDKTAHWVIGLSRERHGIKDIEALRRFLIDSEVGAMVAAEKD